MLKSSYVVKNVNIQSKGPMCYENIEHEGPRWLRCLTMF